MNIWIVFLTGLTTGGISCLAVQGGLLASTIANQGKTANNIRETFASLGLFLAAKLLAYTLLGALLGWVGSVLAPSLGVRLAFQVATALFMFATAMNLLEVHPIFRFVAFQPPKFLQRLVRNETKSASFFAPAMLGVLTIFIPCGVTQAMEVLAISTGKPVLGAVTMFAFVLGTSPIFGLIGLATAKFSRAWNGWFLQIAAVVLLFMSIISINGVLTVLDAPVTFQKIIAAVSQFGAPPSRSNTPSAETDNGVQKITISVANNGYSPKYFTVKSGIPVQMTLRSNGAYSCATAFTFKKFNISLQLGPNDEKLVTFTPQQKGKFTFSCAMGMYGGVMEVI